MCVCVCVYVFVCVNVRTCFLYLQVSTRTNYDIRSLSLPDLRVLAEGRVSNQAYTRYTYPTFRQNAKVRLRPNSILEATKDLWIVSVQHENIRTSNCSLTAALIDSDVTKQFAIP